DYIFFFFQAEDGIRDFHVTGVQTCALPIGKVVKATINVGWDEEFGGLLRFVMPDGSPPVGPAESSSEQMILDTWNTKIWWPHSEALYTTALAGLLTGDDEHWRLHEKVWQYTFDTFPNPDKSVGEWINIRDRQGQPLDKVVGLPVKDPFHIIRNLMLLVDVLADGVHKGAGPLSEQLSRGWPDASTSGRSPRDH